MKTIDNFLEQHQIDVGRSLGLLSLAGAVVSIFEVIGQLFIGRINIDLTGPVGIVVGLALWRHAAWARTLLLVVTWAVTVLFTCLLAMLPVIGSAHLRLTVGSTVIQEPPLWQAYTFGAMVTPFIWFVLSVLHSEKAKTEFKKPSKTPQTTAITPPPSATPLAPLSGL